MRQYFVKLENDHSAPFGTPGHGFSGFLDIVVNDNTLLTNISNAQTVLKAVATKSGQNPEDIFDLIHNDLNNNDANRDQQTGMFGFPAHRDLEDRRVSARNGIVETLKKTSKLTLQLTSRTSSIPFHFEQHSRS